MKLYKEVIKDGNRKGRDYKVQSVLVNARGYAKAGECNRILKSLRMMDKGEGQTVSKQVFFLNLIIILR